MTAARDRRECDTEVFPLSVPRSLHWARHLTRVSFFVSVSAGPWFSWLQWRRADVLEATGGPHFWPLYLGLLVASAGCVRWFDSLRQPQFLSLSSDGLRGPSFLGASRVVEASLQDLLYVRRRGRRDRESLRIGVRDRRAFAFTAAQLGGPEALERLEGAVREHLAALPDAQVRLAYANACVALLDRTLRRVPWCTLGFAVLMCAGFAYSFWTRAEPVPLQVILLGGASADFGLAAEWQRVFSMALLHLGVLHLIANLSALGIVGFTAENALGHARFALVLLLSIAGGSLSLVATEGQPAVGASGGVMGVAAALFWMLHKLPVLASGRGAVHTALFLTLAVQIAADLLLPNVSRAAHLGGAVTGLAVSVLLMRKIDWPDTSLASTPGQKLGAVMLTFLFCIAVARTIALDPSNDLARVDTLAQLIVEHRGLSIDDSAASASPVP